MKPSVLSLLLSHTIPAHLPVLLVSPPGCGKSDLTAQAAEACKADLILEHPAVADPTNYSGLPFAVDGKAAFLPFGNLRRAIEADRLTVLFLDDLGQAPSLVQAACMQLILARRVGEHSISPHVTFVAATNRRQDRAGVTGLLEPVKSRFASIVTLEPDIEDSARYALAQGWPVPIVMFWRWQPRLFHAPAPSPDLVNTPSPRTWGNVARLMALNLPPALEYDAYAGAIGEAAAATFCGFLKIYRTLPDPAMILMNPQAANVPTDPATLYALAGALARRASEQTIGRLVTYFNRMPAEFSVLAMRDSAQVCPAIAYTAAWQQWTSDHADVLL